MKQDLIVRGLFTFFTGATPVRNFGIMQEYNERRNKKLINNFLLVDRPHYWVTSSRPSNFGDPLDAKTKADNWFDENRYVFLSYKIIITCGCTACGYQIVWLEINL